MRLQFRRAACSFALAALGAAGAPASSSAATEIYIKMAGVTGSSRDPKHEGEIEASSIQFGVAQAMAASAGTGAGSGRSRFSDVVLTKAMDRSSPTLLNLCLQGRGSAEALITMRKSGDAAVDYYKIKLSNVQVSAYALSSGGELPMESISLNFAAVEWEYFTQQADGSVKSAGKVGWDVRRNQATTAPAPGSAPAPGPPNLAAMLNRLSIQRLGGSRSLSGATILAVVDGMKGDSRDAKYPGAIELGSFQFGVTAPAAGLATGTGSARTGRVQVSDISVTKALDGASVPLMFACASGRHIQNAVISFLKPGGARTEYLKIKLSDVLVTGSSQSAASSADLPMESVSLNFAKMDWDFSEQDEKGVFKSIGRATWDVKQGRP